MSIVKMIFDSIHSVCDGLTCASVWSKTWKSQPDVFKLNNRTFNMASTSGLRTRREKEQLGMEKKVWWQRGIQESVVEKPQTYLSRRENFFTLLCMSTHDSVDRYLFWSFLFVCATPLIMIGAWAFSVRRVKIVHALYALSLFLTVNQVCTETYTLQSLSLHRVLSNFTQMVIYVSAVSCPQQLPWLLRQTCPNFHVVLLV